MGAISRFLKRGMDIIGALTGLLFLLPVMILVGVVVVLDSGLPILFRQSRIGRDGRPFTIYKFRTMLVSNGEQDLSLFAGHTDLRLDWVQLQKILHDPRITRVGRALRQYSLDELPQLWNVLRGEMSLVGPRPCLPGQMDLYGTVFPLYTSVRPGLTGLWQVSGRNRLSFSERVELDAEYVSKWDWRMEIKILIKTIWVVIRREGAF